MMRPTLYATAALLLAACAAPGPSGEAPKTPAANSPSAQAVEKAPPAADELYTSLSALESKGSVLGALPPDVRKALEQRVDHLSAEQKRALLDANQAYAYQRPLLHLVAGGDALGAYTSLFASPAGADELVELRYESGNVGDLPPVIMLVAERAATHVLRTRAASVAPGVERKQEVLGEIAAAAEFLRNDSVYQTALDALVREFPDPRWAFMRAGALARQLEPQAALEALPKATDVDAGHAKAADTLIAAARTAVEPAQTPEQGVARARALLMLDLDAEARETLQPFGEQRATHLALATATLRAEAGTGPCPTLRAPLGNAPLCQAAWKEFLTQERLQLLEAAWQSGKGRDVDAVDAWLGLSHVVPLMYGFAADEKAAMAHLTELEQSAQSATSVADRYHGVALLASGLQAAFAASVETPPGRSPEIPKAARQALIQRASKNVERAPDDAWNQASALAVAAVLIPQENTLPLLRQMNDTVRAEWRITQASLLLWNLLADGAVGEFTQSKGLLGRAAETSAEGSYERSRWVILWAEADAHLQPSEQSFKIVQDLAERLKAPQVPLGVRLRMALNVAGIKARQGDFASGIALLEPIVAATPRAAVQTRQEQELLVTATGYEAVLRALSTTGEERGQQIQVLQELLDNVAKASAAPPALMMWLALWKGELDAIAAKHDCEGKVACQRKADALRGVRTPVFERVIGPRMAALLRRGVLPLGGVDLEFRYRSGKLVPEVKIDPAFLLVHMPTLDGAR